VKVEKSFNAGQKKENPKKIPQGHPYVVEEEGCGGEIAPGVEKREKGWPPRKEETRRRTGAR